MHFSELPQHGNHAYPTPIQLDPAKLGTCLVLSDVHAPYTNKEAFEAALDDAAAQGVTSVIINGDFLDMHRVSRYGTNYQAPNVQAEIDYAPSLLDYIDEVLDNPPLFGRTAITTSACRRTSTLTHRRLQVSPAPPSTT